MNDTLPEAQAAQWSVHRRMSGERRVSILFAMSEEARLLTMEGLRRRFPQASEAELVHMERRFRLGAELADAAWPDRAGR